MEFHTENLQAHIHHNLHKSTDTDHKHAKLMIFNIESSIRCMILLLHRVIFHPNAVQYYIL